MKTHRWVRASASDFTGPIPQPRSGHTAVNIGKSKVVFFGGLADKRFLNDVAVYDIDNNMWFQPECTGGGSDGKVGPSPRAFHVAVAIDCHMFIFGGRFGGNRLGDFWVLDTDIWQWSELTGFGDLPSSRDFAAASSIGNSKIVMYGGWDGKKWLSDVYVLDTISLEWTELSVLGTIPPPRCGHSVTMIEKRLLMYGGRGGGGPIMGDLWALKGLIKEENEVPGWTQLKLPGQAPSPRCGHTIASGGPYLLLFGGHGTGGWLSRYDIYYNDCVVLDRVSVQWKRLPTSNESPAARAYHSMNSVGSRYLLFGGFDGKSTYGDLWWLVPEDDPIAKRLSASSSEVGAQTNTTMEKKFMAESEATENYDPSKDPKRKAKSNDPGWKYGFWPNLSNKDLIECSLCHKQMFSGVKRLKQHLAKGYGDVESCPKTTPAIMKEMQEYIQKKVRNKPFILDDDEGEDGSIGASSKDSTSHPSSGTASKRKLSVSNFFEQQPKVVKQSKSVATMLRKSPEEVIEERHSKGPTQTTIEQCTKSKEEIERVKMHIANFFYECGIPFNAANSRSYEIMVESIGQFGPGLKPPTYHELRKPYLEKAKKETENLKEKQEKAWKEYGCTLMADGWTDRWNRHLINFLANSPEGTFFLGSVDASSQCHDAPMLANLLETKIDEIGRDKVVQIVTDNGANYKAAGKLLEQRISTLFWTPCAAHCLDLMLEDIGKLKDFKRSIESARRVTVFIYRHGRVLDTLREKTNGRDLVRPGATRFATAFLTLQSLYKHKDALRMLFVGEDWSRSKLASTEAGKRVCDIVLSSRFWTAVENCIRASQPLLIVMRIVDADEIPAMPELSVAMDHAKNTIKESFANKPRVLKSVLDIIEARWADQMEVKLYGAALFLNPSKYFDLKQSDLTYAAKQRGMFNNVLEKMVTDEALQIKISNQVDDYEYMRGSFEKQLAIKQQKTKSPLDWWNAFGVHTIELQLLAKRIIGLCCSSSGCERNWSTFEFEGQREGSAVSELQKRLELSPLLSNPELIIDELKDKELTQVASKVDDTVVVSNMQAVQALRDHWMKSTSHALTMKELSPLLQDYQRLITLHYIGKDGSNLEVLEFGFPGKHAFHFYHVKSASQLRLNDIPSLLAEYKDLLLSTSINRQTSNI